MKAELNNPSNEIRTNTFTHDGVEYDLDIVRKAVRNLPRNLVKVEDMLWLLEECDWSVEDEKRHAYLGRPLFVVLWQGKICVVDGYHRLHRAVRKRLERMPVIWIPDEVMNKARM